MKIITNLDKTVQTRTKLGFDIKAKNNIILSA